MEWRSPCSSGPVVVGNSKFCTFEPKFCGPQDYYLMIYWNCEGIRRIVRTAAR